MLQSIILLKLIGCSLTYSLVGMSQEQQYQTYSLNIAADTYEFNTFFASGVWTRYAPLDGTSQIGNIGMFDSNCFNIHYAMDSSSNLINFLYYDCIDLNSNQITKSIKFLTEDGNFNFSIIIANDQYEFQWFYFQFTQWPIQRRLELIVVQTKSMIFHEILNIACPYLSKNQLLIYGGGLYIDGNQLLNINNLQNFSYFPGKMVLYPLELGQIEIQSDFLDVIIDAFKFQYDCNCDTDFFSVISRNFVEQDILIQTSNAKYCDQFTLSGWIRIFDIKQLSETFTYQFIKMCPNSQNQKIINQNLCAFQLFYEISKNLNKIIVTTYSYQLPSVNNDFSQNLNLILKEFEIIDIQQWHFVQVVLVDNIFTILINIFQNQQNNQFLFQQQVQQFRLVQFQFQFGNLLQSQQNLLSISVYNFNFENCSGQVQEIICAPSCETCDGPHDTDCLTCNENQKRIYFPKEKICICPYGFIDDQICKTFSDYNLQINPQISEQTNQCNFGYFENDNGNCFQCPTIMRTNIITCQECVLNPQNWIKNPICSSYIALDAIGSPFQLIVSQDIIYLFDGENLNVCEDCENSNDEIHNYQNFIYSQQGFKKFCSESSSIFDIVNPQRSECYSCGGISYCVRCKVTATGQQCLQCDYSSILEDGICTGPKLIGKLLFNTCQSPYYINSKKECKLCPIKNCIYCFEYLKDDLSFCTLYSGFSEFDITESHSIGCSLCKDAYIFDFTKDECVQTLPTIKNCSRAFINLNGQELCTLSRVDDFTIAPEIEYCQRYISKCQQCIQTPQQQIKCIICEDNYTASITSGQCYPCSVKNAKTCIEGNYLKLDAWVQLIQSFLMQFLPNKYIYPKTGPIYQTTSLAIYCDDGYALTLIGQCVLGCDKTCLACEQKRSDNFQSTCQSCGVNYYNQPILSSVDGVCFECQLLCEICIPRSDDEIKVINSNFIMTEENKFFSYKCLKNVNDSKIKLNPYLMNAKYCFDETCQRELVLYVEATCENISIITIPYFDSYYEKRIDINYCNQMGIERLTINFDFQFYSSAQMCYFTNPTIITNNLKQQIFTLQLLSCNIVGTSQLDNIFFDSLIIENYDNINFTDINFESPSNNFTITFLNQQNLLKQLQFQNIFFYSLEETQYFQISANQSIQNFNAHNVTLLNMIIHDSIIFNLSAINVLIDRLIIINCTFYNTVIIYVSNSTNLQIFNVTIYLSEFYNSTFFRIQQNQLIQFSFELNKVQLMQVNFENSTIFSNIQEYQSKYSEFVIQNFLITETYFTQSNLFITNKNISIKNLEFQNNTFTNTFLFITDSIQKEILLFKFEGWVLFSSIFKNSTIIYLIQNQKIYVEITFFLFNDIMSPINQNDYLFQIQAINLSIQWFYILESQNIRVFYILQTIQAQFNSILIQNTNQLFRIKSQLDCYPYIDYSFKFLQVAGFTNIQMFNIELDNLFSFDQSFIQIQSDLLFNPNTKETISFTNISISNSIILKLNLGNLFSLIAIFSEKIQQIQFFNITFIQNTFHQYIDDPSQTSAGLMYIGSQQSEISMDLLQSDLNHMTNSTHSFFVFLSQTLQIKNFSIQNHNYKADITWIEIYNINSDVPLDQDKIYFIVQSIFTIQNVGGAFSITTASLILENGMFYKIIAESSAALDIKTQGEGVVVFNNLKFANISVDLSQFVDLSSCINIQSKNSLLKLQIIDATFLFVFNNLGSAILSIVPSQKQNVLIMKNIRLENCISLTNILIKIEFQENNIFSNYVQIVNLEARISLDGQQKFYELLGIFAIEDSSKIVNDNALINLKGCDFKAKNVSVSGVFLSSILKLQNIKNLSLNQVEIFEIEQLYQFNMISISQTTQKMKVKMNNLNIKKSSLSSFSSLSNLIQQTEKKLNLSNQECQVIYKVTTTIVKNNSLENFMKSLNSETRSNQSLIYVFSGAAEIIMFILKVTFTQNFLQQNNNLNGFYFEFATFLNLKISEFQCLYNYFFESGCLALEAPHQVIQTSQIKVKNSHFFSNNGGYGVGIFSKNVNLFIDSCNFVRNNSTNYGGAIYFDGQNQIFSIRSTIITNNSANYGGGIFINNNQHLTNQNFVKSFLLFNMANIFSNNINEQPLFLQLSINNMQMGSIQIDKNSTFIQQLQISPYRVIEQGKAMITNKILFPSGQRIINYQLFNIQKQSFSGYINEMTLSFRNSYGEEVLISTNNSCSIQQNIYENNTIQNMTFFQPLFRNSQTGKLDLGEVSITFDPFGSKDKFSQLQISCPTDNNIDELIYYLNSRSFMCQLGEFYIDEGCEECQSNQGFYSVQYNSTKCSIFDKTKFKTITSNKIELLNGFWRPNLLSDQIESCFKEESFCIGGWETGNQLCLYGHIGGLCEECDIYDIRGDGRFFRSLKNLECYSCLEFRANLVPFLLASLWSFLSIALTLRSVEKSNKLYTSLRLNQKYFRILFKLNQDHESILLKMLINYLWIFSVIFTFNIDFQISLSFADQAANPIQFMTNNLDCYLSEAFQISIIYIKVMFMIVLILLELMLITFIYKIFSMLRKTKFDKSIISTTAIYLFVSNHASLIKNFCSLLAKRIISDIDFIQGNVSFLYNTQSHKIWMLGFIFPGLGICGLLIPIGLFLTIFVQRRKLDEIKKRKYICYLFNEYNQNSYFWEQIKIWQKTLIIIILTYYETQILAKISFLGISLLLYQKLALRYQPYNISNLNKIDVDSVQICSFTIFLAAIAYSYQQENLQLAFFIQIIIILLFIRLCLPFIYDAFRVYYKKYKIPFVSALVTFLKKIKITSSATYILTRKLNVWKEKQVLLQNNVEKLRNYLISISKVQIEQQRVLTSQLSPLTSVRSKQNSRECETKKIIRFDL